MSIIKMQKHINKHKKITASGVKIKNGIDYTIKNKPLNRAYFYVSKPNNIFYCIFPLLIVTVRPFEFII